MVCQQIFLAREPDICKVYFFYHLVFLYYENNLLIYMVIDEKNIW